MDSAELEWIAWTNPITTAFGTEVAASDLSGRTVACHQHVLPDSICILGPLLEAGARVRMAPCNPDSTDDHTATHLASMGVEIRGRAGMSAAEHADALAWLASEPADALCDMGGELIAATATAGYRPAGAIEATTTGLHRLAGLDIPFPVLDWNGIALKDLVHNRHHVGAETWPAFTAITGLSLYGREIVVIGFGPVGKGVALRARDLGANVTVVDLDPVRLVQAQHPHTGLRRHLERYEVNGRRVHLLNRGSLVNLAAGLGTGAPQMFDPFAAIMLLGLDAILQGRTAGLSAGVQRYPAQLETRVARALVDGTSD